MVWSCLHVAAKASVTRSDCRIVTTVNAIVVQVASNRGDAQATWLEALRAPQARCRAHFSSGIQQYVHALACVVQTLPLDCDTARRGEGSLIDSACSCHVVQTLQPLMLALADTAREVAAAPRDAAELSSMQDLLVLVLGIQRASRAALAGPSGGSRSGSGEAAGPAGEAGEGALRAVCAAAFAVQQRGISSSATIR